MNFGVKSVNNETNLSSNIEWEDVANDIDVIFENGFLSSQHFIEIYTRAYDYCLSISTIGTQIMPEPTSLINNSSSLGHNSEYRNPCHYLYDHLNEHLINNQIKMMREELLDCQDVDLVSMYTEKWIKFKSGSETLSSAYSYVTRVWCSDNLICSEKNYIKTIFNMSLLSWSRHLYRPCAERIYQIVFNLIDDDRRGIITDFTHVKALFTAFFELGAGDYASNSTGLFKKNIDDNFIEVDEFKTVISEDFSTKYISVTSNYYESIAMEFFSKINYSYSSYSNFVISLYQEERNRCESFFSKRDINKVISSMDTILILPIHDKITNEFFVNLKEQRYQDIINMYALIRRTSISHSNFKTAFESFLCTIIDEELARCKENGVLRKDCCFQAIKLFIGLYNKFYNIIMIFMGGSLDIRILLSNVFQAKLNSFKIVDNNSIEQIVAFYIHKKLSKWYKLYCDNTQFNDSLKEHFYDWILLVYFIDNKDAYMSYHEYYLAERVLKNHLEKIHTENSFLEFLSLILKNGKQLTESTFNIDLRNPHDNFEPYYNLRYYLDSSPDGPSKNNSTLTCATTLNNTCFMISNVEIITRMKQILEDYITQQRFHLDILTYKNKINTVVLNSTIWPYHIDSPIVKDFSNMTVAPSLSTDFRIFSNDYYLQYPNRKIQLFHQKSTVVLDTGDLFDNKYSLILNLPQACVLMQFNHNTNKYISIGDIIKSINIPQNIIYQIVSHFHDVKLINIYNCDGGFTEKDNMSHCDTDIISINTCFTSPTLEVDLIHNFVYHKEQTPLLIDANENNKSDGKYLIQSIIMSYLKENGNIHQSDVFEFVRTKLSSRFVPNVDLVQDCVASLIDKEFIAVSPTDPDIYIYLS